MHKKCKWYQYVLFFCHFIPSSLPFSAHPTKDSLGGFTFKVIIARNYNLILILIQIQIGSNFHFFLFRNHWINTSMLHKRYTYSKQGDTNNMTVKTNKKYVHVNIVYVVGKILSLHIFCFWSKRKKKRFFLSKWKWKMRMTNTAICIIKLFHFNATTIKMYIYLYKYHFYISLNHYCYYGLDYFGTQMVINK